MKKKILFSFLFISLLFLAGCGKKNNANEEQSNTDANNEVTDKIDEEEKKIQIVDLDSDSRPYAVVINNFPIAVKVQTGLSDAYLIYEIPVEGVSRSLAFYKDKTTSKIGTVRSARHNFLDYVMENDAIFVHFGWSHYAQDQIPQLGINNINGLYDPPFWRENPESLPYEHTAYTSLEQIMSYADTKGYRKTTDNKGVLNYSSKEIDLSNDGIVANNVEIPYASNYKVSFSYDSENKVYKRYVNGVAHTDYFTKEHYSAKNIIVVKLDYHVIPNDNKESYLDLHNIGTGEGYYITNGHAVPITWEKETRSSKTLYKYKDGSEIRVNDGNTYIMLQYINDETRIS